MPGGIAAEVEEGRDEVVGPSNTSERWERRRLRFAATSDVDRLVRDWRWSDLARCSFQRGSRSSTKGKGKRVRLILFVFFWCLWMEKSRREEKKTNLGVKGG